MGFRRRPLLLEEESVQLERELLYPESLPENEDWERVRVSREVLDKGLSIVEIEKRDRGDSKRDSVGEKHGSTSTGIGVRGGGRKIGGGLDAGGLSLGGSGGGYEGTWNECTDVGRGKQGSSCDEGYLLCPDSEGSTSDLGIGEGVSGKVIQGTSDCDISEVGSHSRRVSSCDHRSSSPSFHRADPGRGEGVKGTSGRTAS